MHINSLLRNSSQKVRATIESVALLWVGLVATSWAVQVLYFVYYSNQPLPVKPEVTVLVRLLALSFFNPFTGLSNAFAASPWYVLGAVLFAASIAASWFDRKWLIASGAILLVSIVFQFVPYVAQTGFSPEFLSNLLTFMGVTVVASAAFGLAVKRLSLLFPGVK